jgi:hypothetical protein
MPTGTAERLFRALIALAAFAGLGIQLWILLESPDFASQLAAVWRFLAFFTILTNLMVAIVSAVSAIAPNSASGRLLAGANTRAGVVLYIGLVGIVYHVLLAGLWDPQGWQKIADLLLHTATPVMMAIAWILFDAKKDLTLKALPQIIVYPVAYTVYAMIRGAGDGFYPYPFIDVSELGYARVLMNVVGLTAAFLFASGLLILIGKTLSAVGFRTSPVR